MTRRTVLWIAAGIAALVLLGIYFLCAPSGLLHTIQPIDRDNGFYAVALSPDGKTLATAFYRSPTVVLRDVETGKQITSLGSGTRRVSNIHYSPRGDRILVKVSGYIAYLWSLPDNRLLHTFPRDGHNVRAAFTEEVITLIKRVRKSDQTTISIYDPADGSIIRTFDMPRAERRIWLTRNGQRAFTLDYTHSRPRRVLWDMQNNKPLATCPVVSHIQHVHFTPDGQRLAIGDNNGDVSIWSIPDNAIRITYKAHENGVSCIAASNDGRFILSSNYDVGILRTLEGLASLFGLSNSTYQNHERPTPTLSCAETGKILRTFSGHKKGVHTVAFTPDTTRAITASKDRIQIWDISDLKTETQL